jgi:hypothetical protein
MTYTILDNKQFTEKEKQDKLDLDLFRKVVNQSCQKTELIYKLLDKGANPMRFDGDIIKQAFHQTGINQNNLDFFIHCYEKYDEVKTYVHNELNLGIALREPVRHLGALLYLVNSTNRQLTPNELERLNNPPINLVQGNLHAINVLNQAIAKKDLFSKMNEKHQANPVKAKTTTMKLKI